MGVDGFDGSGEKPEVESRLARLQSRKAEIEKEIETKRAATRFEPEVDENESGREQLERVIGEQIDETADRRRPTKRDKSLDVTAEEKSYTSRLLDAKRKAQKDQNRPNDSGDSTNQT